MRKSDVIKYYKSARNVAIELNISESAVSQWGDTVPKYQALVLEMKTKGALKASVADPKKAA